ncbi:MAG: replicative DNA helicase [bacterium]|nr:replicative DNA helicase [bacterium]
MVKTPSLPTTDRTLPHNLDAERKTLGAMIRDREALHRAHEILGRDAFYQPSHQIIYDALIDLDAQSIAIDLTTLADALDRGGRLETIGGPFYIAELAQSVATSANVAFHARIVRQHAMRRMLIRQCSEIIQTAYEGADEAEIILSDAEASIFRLAEQRGGRSFNPVGKFLDAALEKIQMAQEQQGSLTGLTSGFRDLDAMTSGFQASDLIVLAARPSVGKTSLVLNFAEAAAMTGAGVGVFSLEMSSEQIAERVLCSQARVNLKHMRSGFFTRRDANQLLKTAAEIHDMPLYIDDTPNLTPTEVMSRARRLKAEVPSLGMIIIDYLQLMSSSRRSDNRQQEVAEISRALKILARDINVPIIACSQLSRAVEKRDDHLPRLSDLRESGAIEQDADLVVFIHREPLKGAYEGDEEDVEAGQQHHFTYKLIIAKHRNGPVGEVDIYFAKEYTRFFDAARDDRDDEEVPF